MAPTHRVGRPVRLAGGDAVTIILVTGSRALADTPAARWWATQRILRALADLPLGSMVVTGDASGVVSSISVNRGSAVRLTLRWVEG